MKKNISFFLICIFFYIESSAQSVTINPSSQSIIDAKGSASNPKGILVPRMTSAERTNSGLGWADGALVYDTDTKNFWYFNASTLGWVKIAAGNVGLDLPFNGTTTTGSLGAAFQVTNEASSDAYSIYAQTKTGGTNNIAIIGLDNGYYGVGVDGYSAFGVGIRGRTLYGGLGGMFDGGVKVFHDRQTYDVPELELLRGFQATANQGSNIRTARLAMGKYTNGQYNNRWIFDAKVEGTQSQPNDRFKLQYSTNSFAASSGAYNYTQNDILIFKPSGEMGIGIEPTEKLDINGNVKLNGKISANGSFGTDGQVLTSRGNSLPAEWRAVPTIGLTINNLTSDTYTGNNISQLSGSFTLTKTSKVTVHLYGSLKKYSNCFFNCGTDLIKITTCIGTTQYGCTTGQEVAIAQIFNEPSTLNSNVQLTGDASKTFVLSAGTYYYKTDFSVSGTNTGGSNWQLDGTSNSPTQMTIQVLDN